MSADIDHSDLSQIQDVVSPPSRIRILCVEDNDVDYALLKEHIRDAEFSSPPEFTRATSLKEATRLLDLSDQQLINFDVILLDLSLPDSQGPDTLDAMSEVAHGTPVIILSGNEDRDLAVEMVKRGAQDYLPKYFLSGDLLLRSILYALERQRSRLQMRTLNEQLTKTTHELKTAQMQLIQAEKLDSLGRLAAGVAHEVKNPLATLQMGVDFFARKTDQIGKPGALMVTHMQEAIESADRIIRGMLDYARSDALEMDPRNINVVVRKALRMVSHEVIKNHVTVERDLTRLIPGVSIDEGKMTQVIINVLINSIQAMASSTSDRVLQVKTFYGRLETIDRDLGLRVYDRLRVRDLAVVVEIRDCGAGIPEEKINRVFEPFFTTKPTGEGTGLGLSVAKNIVDLHRGHFQISNVANPQGLRVRIFLKARQVGGELKDEPLTDTLLNAAHAHITD